MLVLLCLTYIFNKLGTLELSSPRGIQGYPSCSVKLIGFLANLHLWIQNLTAFSRQTQEFHDEPTLDWSSMHHTLQKDVYIEYVWWRLRNRVRYYNTFSWYALRGMADRSLGRSWTRNCEPNIAYDLFQHANSKNKLYFSIWLIVKKVNFYKFDLTSSVIHLSTRQQLCTNREYH